MRRIDYSNTQRCKERERRVQGDRQGLPAMAGRECVGETLAVSLHTPLSLFASLCVVIVNPSHLLFVPSIYVVALQ